MKRLAAALLAVLGHHDPSFTVREYVGTMDEGIGSADFLDDLLPIDMDGDGCPPSHPSRRRELTARAVSGMIPAG